MGSLQRVQSIMFEGTIIPVIMAGMRLFPDGLVVASGLYALITLSFANGIFFMSLCEASVVYRIIQSFSAFVGIFGGSYVTYGSSRTETCRSGFTSQSEGPLGLSMLGNKTNDYLFPSSPIFMFTTAATYLFTTLNFQSQELEALGPAYSSRYYSSAALLLVLLGIIATFRMVYECDSFSSVMGSMAIGLMLGYLLVLQNALLFGPSSINMIGIPLLRNKTVDGKKIYVCPK
jgi:hypothetical protein